MTEQQGSTVEILCPVCGRALSPAAMVWSEHDERPICRDCLAEEESCGCADE